MNPANPASPLSPINPLNPAMQDIIYPPEEETHEDAPVQTHEESNTGETSPGFGTLLIVILFAALVIAGFVYLIKE